MKKKMLFYHYNLKLSKKTKRRLKKEGTVFADWGYTVIAIPKDTYWVNLDTTSKGVDS